MQPSAQLFIISPNKLLSERFVKQLYTYYGLEVPALELNDLEFPIDTKYYRAKVHFKLLDYQWAYQKQSVDGIIFLVDAQTLEGLEEYINRCDELLTLDPNLQVVIFNRKEGSQINQALIQAEEQKLESFVESVYIDLDEVVIQRDRALADKGDEALGIERIAEILECNTWTSMVQKPQNKIQEPQQKIISKEQQCQEEEQFAQLLGQMKEIRTANLSIEDRRLKAEELINKLMGECQFDDDELSD